MCIKFDKAFLEIFKPAFMRLIRILLGQTAGWLVAEAARLPAIYAVPVGAVINSAFKALRDKFPTWEWIPL
jgi:hypothetical protein